MVAHNSAIHGATMYVDTELILPGRFQGRKIPGRKSPSGAVVTKVPKAGKMRDLGSSLSREFVQKNWY